MGTSPIAVALATATALCCAWLPARADSPQCQHLDRNGQAFPVCFDPGNRIFISATTAGYGGAFWLRHQVPTEPGVSWRLQHRILSVFASASQVQGALYSGQYLRHARDGHIVVPFRPTGKVFIPVDVGAEADFGIVSWDPSAESFDLGVVRAAILAELTRASHFRRRLVVGAVVRWNMRVRTDFSDYDDHRVAPFSRALVDAYLESQNGLTRAHIRAEGGTDWSQDRGWQPSLAAQAAIERVVIALNDHQPISLFLRGGYDSDGTGWHGEIGLRWALSTTGPVGAAPHPQTAAQPSASR